MIEWIGRRAAMDRPEIHTGETPDGEAPASSTTPERSWVHELIEMTRPGFEMRIPPDVTTPWAPPFVYDDFD